MDAIGGIRLQAIQMPATSGQGAALLPAPKNTAAAPERVEAPAAEQKHYEAVLQMAKELANVYVISDKQFTIFKDSTGQYITRFRDLRDGKITYIPEPQLFRMQQAQIPPSLEMTV